MARIGGLVSVESQWSRPMGSKRNGFLALFTAALFVLTGLMAASA